MKFLQILLSLSLIFYVFAFDSEWWKHASIYQIYPRSFKDSDGDGIGDFNGIVSELDYLVDIGVDTVYMNPIYPSSMADGGYDITDYKGIDPVFGTMGDFERLLKEMRRRGLHLVIDLVINHSSDEHEWFQKSIKKIDPYTDYYVWADPKGYDRNGKPIPPNNWFSFFTMHESGSAWTWNEERKQFYLHHCYTKQPDLKLRNEIVKKEVQEIMKFWLDKGVSGFRVDAPMLFMEDEQLRDNQPLSPDVNVFNVFKFCQHTLNHPDTFKYLNELNSFIREYDQKSRRPYQTVLIGETYGSVDTVIKYYGTRRFPSFHLPLNYLLSTTTKYQDARELRDFLHTWLDKVPKGMQSNWALGNHDYGRVAHYFNPEYNSILLALVTMLPGASIIYYGEELNMAANHLVQSDDPVHRTIHRSPMHWDDTRNAGFSTGEKLWLSVHPNYWHVNVQTQNSQENSTLNYFKDLTSLRKTDTLKYGDLKFNILSKWVLTFSRTYKGIGYTIVMNLGTETHPIDWSIDLNDHSNLTVVASSPNSGYRKGFTMKSTHEPVTSILRPHSVVILRSTMNSTDRTFRFFTS